MAKKHCERHYRFVANCPECRAANSSTEENEPTDDERRLYRDVEFEEMEEDTSIPVRPSAQIPRDDPYGGTRYHYSSPISQNGKKIIVLGIIIGVIVALIVGLYAFPLWFAKITLQNQMYTAKAGVNFWTVYSMNLWSTQFFFNKIGLMGGIIGAIIFSFPPETTLMALIGTKTGWGRPSAKKALILNWTLGFCIFYLFGQALDSGYFAYIMFCIEQGTIDASFLANPLKAMLVLVDTDAVTIMDVFIYNNLIYPIIGYIFFLLILRAILNIINNSYLFKNRFKVLANILFIIGLIFGVSYFAYPLAPLDGLMQIQSYSVLIGFIGFIIIGFVVDGVGKSRARQNNYNLDSATRRKIIINAAVVVGLIIVPLFISIPTAISIDNDYNTWSQNRWGVQTSKEVEWTRQAVGLDNFIEYPMEKYTNSVVTSDVDIIKSIRQYDRASAGKKMGNQIGTTFETLADSDIIYIPTGIAKGEYWVAPKTVDVGQIATTPVRRHTELYDHVEGFLALDTYTGELVTDSQYNSTFGVGADYPIFFGEEHDSSYDLQTSTDDLFTSSYSLKAYEDDILLYTQWANNSGDVTYRHRYEGKPDGNLTGMEAFWFTLNMGLTQDAFNGGEKSYLINRNIKTRVGNALLPGLFYDSDPYLVLDFNNGKLYYAVSIISVIDIGSFAQDSLYRFLGVCLVDVLDGHLYWIKNPQLDTINDPLYSLYKIHDDFYDWQLPEGNFAFMKDQMRYPESLWVNQLQNDYIYHVRDAITFYQGNDFYAEPDDTVPYYIETDLGEGLEFVAVQIVEYVGEEATTLAGIYIVRHGDHLGETMFFKVPKQQIIRPIGPGIAQTEYSTQATQELTLIQNRRDGNILLYPLAGELYYFIPTYSAPAGTERLQLTGLVNAFSKVVGYGETALESYTKLNISTVTNESVEENITLDYTASAEFIYNPNIWGLIKTTVQSTETNDTLAAQNLTLQLNVYGVNASVKLYNQAILPVNGTSVYGNVYNYTIANFMLNPGQGFTYPIRITMDPVGFASISFFYRLSILENGVPIIQTELETMTIKNDATP